MYEGQAETRALTHGLGGKERIEHSFTHLWRDSRTGVTHEQAEIGPRGQGAAAQVWPSLTGFYALEDHFEDTAVLHRLHRIGTQIHRDLMQVSCVADHGGIAGFEPGHEPYAGGQRGPEQFQGLLDDGLNVHRDTLTQAAAAEAENAVDECLGAPGRLHDVVHVTS